MAEQVKRKRGRPRKEEKTTPPPSNVPRITYTCFYCGKARSGASQFYGSADPLKTIKLAPICKDCCQKIANRVTPSGEVLGMTVDSLKKVLRILDKPYVEKIYQTSIQEVAQQSSIRSIKNVFGAYMKNIALPSYIGMTWEDSDMFKSTIPYGETEDEVRANLRAKRNETVEKEIGVNKADAIRLLGYDPFKDEAPEDKPLLYAKLIGYLDASPEANEDEMKVSSIIEIVKLFSQAEKINTVIAQLMSYDQLADNISTIKSLEATKKDIMSTALSLAKDNGISFAHNTNSSKGANTLSGKLKKLNELNLREQEVNVFDIGTCEGMSQVADISNASILKQINLNENDYPENGTTDGQTNKCLVRSSRNASTHCHQETNRLPVHHPSARQYAL